MTFKRILPLILLLLSPALTGAKPNSGQKDDCCKILKSTHPLTSLSLYQLDTKFTNDRGETVKLSSLRGHPVVVAMFFSSCQGACPILVGDMGQIRDKLPTAIRKQTAFVLISFDLDHDTPATLQDYRNKRHLDSQWTLLRGDDDSTREIAALLGVKYKKTPTGTFAHSNLITVLNPEGEIVHQREGLTGGLDATAQVIAATIK
jgi:protein SCO1/2